jgi:hypothetical protein
VIDGDTIEIHGKRIRFNGIDAPESASFARKIAEPATAAAARRRTLCRLGWQQRYRRPANSSSEINTAVSSEIDREPTARVFNDGWSGAATRERLGGGDQGSRDLPGSNTGSLGLRCGIDSP